MADIDTRAQSLLPLTSAVFHLLLALADGPLHGYAITKFAADHTQNQISLVAIAAATTARTRINNRRRPRNRDLSRMLFLIFLTTTLRDLAEQLPHLLRSSSPEPEATPRFPLILG